MKNITSNQLYGGMNRRFERRAALLRTFGFKYQAVPELTVAFFTRPHPHRQLKQTITAAEVLAATNRVFRDTLAHVLKRHG